MSAEIVWKTYMGEKISTSFYFLFLSISFLFLSFFLATNYFLLNNVLKKKQIKPIRFSISLWTSLHCIIRFCNYKLDLSIKSNHNEHFKWMSVVVIVCFCFITLLKLLQVQFITTTQLITKLTQVVFLLLWSM